MRSLALLLALTAFSLPGFCAKRVTVEELEHILAADRSLPDAEIARQLSDLELSERLSTTTLERMQTELPGEKTQRALMLLGDASVFLAPPSAAEIMRWPAQTWPRSGRCSRSP